MHALWGLGLAIVRASLRPTRCAPAASSYGHAVGLNNPLFILKLNGTVQHLINKFLLPV